MADVKKKLTKTIIDALTPSETDTWTWDLELPGYGVRVQPSGRKTYVIRYRTAEGAQRKLTLARCADMAPDRARDLARKKFAEVAEGKDPTAEKAAARVPKVDDSATVEELFQGYITNMRAKGRDSAVEVERALLLAKNCAANALGRKKPAKAVTPADIVAYVGSFFKAGHRGAADKHRSYISSAYNWAMSSTFDYTVANPKDWGVTSNPAAVVGKDPGAKRTIDRNLPPAEIRQLWDATLITGGGFSYETGACIRALLACGQRVEETLRMDGAELDLEARIWTMPPEKTKGRKRKHEIPLPEVIISTLRELVEKRGDGPLFPGRTGEERMDHRAVNRAIGRWLEEVEIEHFTTRDIRRTWKSRAGEAGISEETRDLIQQHAATGTGKKHYDRANYLPKMRDGMDTWSRWLAIVLAGGMPPSVGEPRLQVVA